MSKIKCSDAKVYTDDDSEEDIVAGSRQNMYGWHQNNSSLM